MTLLELLESLWPARDNYLRGRGEVHAHEDLAYVTDGHAKQRLDLFSPRGDDVAPLVMFAHGGLWRSQDRKLLRALTGLYSNVGVALAREGFATAVLGYRQSPPDDALRDLGAALLWLKHNASRYRVDASRVALVGHSAGGSLSLSLARQLPDGAPPVCAVVSIAAAYDLPRLAAASSSSFRSDAERYFGDATAMERWSPERHLSRESAPVMAVSALRDPAELRVEHAAFARAAQAAGARFVAREIEGVGHMGVVIEMGRRRDRVTKPVAGFIAREMARHALGDVDVEAIVASALSPKRPMYDAAKGIARDDMSGAEAWAALVSEGVVPSSWSAPSQCFATLVACRRCGGHGSGDHGGPCLACFRAGVELTTPTDSPRSRDVAVSLASLGVDALRSLEASAWRCAQSLTQWVTQRSREPIVPRRVCWCVAPRSSWRPRETHTLEPGRAASEACKSASLGAQGLIRALERAVVPDVDDGDPRSGALVDIEEALLWREAVRAGLTVPDCAGAPEGHRHPVGEPFAALPDPFSARCEAWALGCAIDSIERDGTVVIFVPAV